MYDLQDAVIIIPVRIDQPQRRVNLDRTVAFLREHLNARLYIIEQDEVQRVPIATEFVRDGGTFHKTALFNRAVATTSESILFFLDVDVLVDPAAYHLAYTTLTANQSDLCLLYTRGDAAYRYLSVEPSVLEGKDPSTWMSLLSALEGGDLAMCEGGLVAFRREAFLGCGRFNERFIGYGQEDTELILRARRLGCRYKELPFSIYHQSHEIMYMWNSVKRDHISQHIQKYTQTQPIKTLLQELFPKHPKYVTMTPSGGRLGNVLFELAALFQYARMTCRSPSMAIPDAYQEFLRPLQSRMTVPPPGLPRKRVESLDASSAVFYTEFPLVYDDIHVHDLLGGYLQSPELFQDVRWMFKDLLGSRQDPHAESRVMVHIRRGDYGKYPLVYEQLGHLYYTRAMTYIKTRIPNCTFVVFSDDIETVRYLSFLKRDDVEFFDDTGLSPTAVLQEMTRYSTYILANSTFGLWGALLSRHATTVVAPLHWSRADTSQCLGFWTPIYDPSWVRISNRPLTIRSDNPQFALFAPESDDVCADLEFVTSAYPSKRPNATLSVLLTNHPQQYTAEHRPDSVDYIFTTLHDHIPTPHPSWSRRPVVFVGEPGTLWHFHYIQTVAETLLDTPKLSILMFRSGDTRPGTTFQALNSLFLQTERSWEVLIPATHPPTSPVGHYLFEYLAIPKVLCVLPVGPTIFHAACQARGDLLAYANGHTVSAKNRLEQQFHLLGPRTVIATHYIDEWSQPSLIPASVGARVSTVPDIVRVRNTFLFSRQMMNASYWFDPETLIRFVQQPSIRFIPDLYDWKPGRHVTPAATDPLIAIGHVHSGPLAKTQSSIVSGLTRFDSYQTNGLRTSRAQWIGEIEVQKKLSGLKFLL